MFSLYLKPINNMSSRKKPAAPSITNVFAKRPRLGKLASKTSRASDFMTLCIDFVVLKLPLSSKFNTMSCTRQQCKAWMCHKSPSWKVKNEGEFFPHITWTEQSYAPLCTTFGMAAQKLELNPPFQNPGSATARHSSYLDTLLKNSCIAHCRYWPWKRPPWQEHCKSFSTAW